MTPKQMIDEHRRRHNVMAGHYWNELAQQMAREIERLQAENDQLRAALKSAERSE